MTITFETKIWENDWMYILNGDYLKNIIARCNVEFDKKILYINNVNDRKSLERILIKKVEENVIDEYYFVEDYATEVLDFFEIEKSSFNGGYYYSISELVSIYLCETDYLLHFSGDSYLKRNCSDWIPEAIKLMENSPDVLVANPTWNNRFSEAKRESFEEIDDFYLGYGFSDQCYLVRASDFKKTIYNEKHIDSERYPKYGGELFEKRVDSYMRNHQLKRITSKKGSYISKNFSRGGLPKKSTLIRNLYLRKRLIK